MDRTHCLHERTESRKYCCTDSWIRCTATKEDTSRDTKILWKRAWRAAASMWNRWLWQRCLETPGRTKNKGFWSQQGNCHSWKERDEETALLLWIPSCAASEPVYESFHSHMRTHLGQWLEYLLICRVVRRIQYIGNNDNKYYYKGKDLWDASRDTAMLVSSGHSLWNSKYSIPIFYISLAFGQLIFIIHLISRQHEY